MAADMDSPDQTVQIKKYPNRRYYDATHSRHVTLDDIHRMIVEGHDISVTDSKTGQDITAKVLAQVIVELDPLKLGVFPSAMLHQVIRANEQLVTDFVEKYFNQALMAFLESKQAYEQFLRQSLGLAAEGAANPAATGAAANWMRFMMPAPGSVWPGWPTGPAAPTPPAAESSLQAVVDTLRREVADLQSQLRTAPPVASRKTRSRSKPKGK